MIRRLGRRLRFGERIIQAGDLRKRQRVLTPAGLSDVARVARAGRDPNGHVVVMFTTRNTEYRWHAAAPVLIHRARR